mgnify:CR=1 FL=1
MKLKMKRLADMMRLDSEQSSWLPALFANKVKKLNIKPEILWHHCVNDVELRDHLKSEIDRVSSTGSFSIFTTPEV